MDKSMVAYLALAHRLLKQFSAFQIRQIPRLENSHANALSLLALGIEVLARWSTTEVEVHAIWQDPS